MAYSRWGSSTWYTFWSADSCNLQYRWPTQKIKRLQCFQICDMPSFTFTYGELKDKGICVVLGEICDFYKKAHPGKILKSLDINEKFEYEDTVYPAKNPSEDEVLELFKYICEWEKDIDEHFKFWTFIKYEWWYPTRNKILWKIQSIRSKLIKKSKQKYKSDE